MCTGLYGARNVWDPRHPSTLRYAPATGVQTPPPASSASSPSSTSGEQPITFGFGQPSGTPSSGSQPSNNTAPSAPQPNSTSSSGSSSAATVLWSVALTSGANYLSVPCTIAGTSFSSCRLDTASPLSAVLSPATASGLGIAEQENFTVDSLAGSSQAYAGLGSIAVAGHQFQGYVTVAAADSETEPDLGLPTLTVLCTGTLQIDQPHGTLACIAG